MRLYGISILKRIVLSCRECRIKFIQTAPGQRLCEACRNGDGEA